MKTLHIVTIILLVSSPALYLSNLPVSAKGICTGLEPRYIRLEDGVLSSQSIQTGENVTITGKIVSLTDKTLQGRFLFYSEPGTEGKWTVLSTTPSGDFAIPGNSVIPYSITAKALFPGRYHIEAGIDLVGLGRSAINNGCPAPDNIRVSGNPICTIFPVAVIKAEDGSPACVRYTTANSLIERGWATKIVPDMASLGPTVTIPINSSNISNGFTFTPQTVKVTIGINNTIRWINMDSVTNDITSNSGSFSSGLIESGFAWTHAFDKSGSYGYHSDIHPWLKGEVRVTVNPLAILANDTGLITLGNQTYYFVTPRYSQDAYTNSPQTSFHGVIFTLFPSGFRGGLPFIYCGLQGLGLGQYYWVDSKFSDNTHELLNLFAYSPSACNKPIPFKFSKHTNPQAGLAFYEGTMKLLVSEENQTGNLSEFDGVIVDQSLDATHYYSFYTNDTSEKFNIGSNGVWLEGLNNIDGLDGKHVKIFGTLMQVSHREDEIKVDKFQIIGSYVPKASPTRKMAQQITLEELYSNPDKYYNQTVTVLGQLREYDNPIAYAGVGCNSAQFTTSKIFVPDFVSRHQLYNGQNYIGVRIGGPDDVGYSPAERLPADLKNKSVFVTGIFVPEIHDTGMCMHILHESGYLLTDFDKIQPASG